MTTCTCCGQYIARVRFIRHDAGKAQSKRPRQHNDCAVRALAIALDSPYDEVYDALAISGRESSRGTYNRQWQGTICKYADSHPIQKGVTTIGQFIYQYPIGRFALAVRGHILALVDGICYDLTEPKWHEPLESAWRVHTVQPKLVADYHFA